MHLREADALARTAHMGQVDKIGVPYIDHVRAVAQGLTSFDREVQIAGLLHDVVEDTDWTLERLLRAGVPVRSVRIVDAVTKRPGMTREQQIEQVVAAGYDAILVKISDNAHNSLESRIQRIAGQASVRKTQDRLRKKYTEAREVLWRNAEKENIERILRVVNPLLLDQLRRTKGGVRTDIPVLEVAQRWLSGESMEDISTSFHCSSALINTRIVKARKDFPDLPWNDRKEKELPGGSGIKNYVGMNDGKPGDSRVREGSVIRARGSLRRGM